MTAMNWKSQRDDSSPSLATHQERLPLSMGRLHRRGVLKRLLLPQKLWRPLLVSMYFRDQSTPACLIGKELELCQRSISCIWRSQFLNVAATASFWTRKSFSHLHTHNRL